MTSPSGRVHSYVLSKLAPLHVDFVSYMDEVAGEVGARPSLLWLFFTDYQLFKRILWGPVTAYQYRLVGPGKWAGARGAIFTQFDRMFKPLKTREVGNVRRRFYEHCVELSGCIMTPVPPSPCPPIPPSLPAGGGEGLSVQPSDEAEPDRRGWSGGHLLRPRAPPGRYDHPAV